MRNGFEKPWCVSIELTQGCNRRCLHCGIHSLYRKKEDVSCQYMSVETAEIIAEQLASWIEKFRISFALHGEPLLNERAPEIINVFREKLPKADLVMISNGDVLRPGGLFVPQRINGLFESGLNVLALDYYGEQEKYSSFKDDLRKAADGGIDLFDLYADKRVPWHYKNPNKTKEIVVLDYAIRNDYRIDRSLDNQGGNSNPSLLGKVSPMQKDSFVQGRCSQPFRDMAVAYDGTMIGCCLDWRREMVFGNVSNGHLKDFWNGRQINLFRKMLWQRERLLAPCVNCNYKSRKVGLLPDPMPGIPYISDDVFSELFAMQKANSVYANKYAYKKWD